MKKKISVISLILLFFFATIGLPLSVNLCSLMETSQADLCEMHAENKCENEMHNVSVKNEITKEDCCKTEIVDKSICDKYLQVNTQKLIPNQNIIAVLANDISANYNFIINPVKFFNDTSPPSLLNNHIYLDNSILLI